MLSVFIRDEFICALSGRVQSLNLLFLSRIMSNDEAQKRL